MIQPKMIPLSSFAKIFTFGQGKKFCSLNSLIGQDGNKKVPVTTCIFNLCAAHDCPSRKLGLCAAAKAGVKCYAVKAEYKYHPLVLPYRRRQEAYWKKTTAEQFASQFLLINSLKKHPFTALRISEAGDFHSQEDVDKAEKIAMLLNRYGIKTYCYTSRSDLDFSKIRHLIVSGSGFRKPGITNEFKIVFHKKERPRGYGICPMNCRGCTRCMVRGKKTVVMAH